MSELVGKGKEGRNEDKQLLILYIKRPIGIEFPCWKSY